MIRNTSLLKVTRDYLKRLLLEGGDVVPRELLELHDYFRMNGKIHFRFQKEGEVMVVVSTDFRQGSIVSSGKDEAELDKNIKDAILTAFEVPSSYAKDTKIFSVKGNYSQNEYALA